MRKDWIAGVVLLALAGGYYGMATTITRSHLSDVVGAATFPKALAVTLAVLSGVLILAGALRRAPAASAEEKAAAVARDLHGFARAAGTLAIGVVCLLILPYVGYIVGIALLLLAMLLYFHERLSWTVVITAVAGSLVLWLVFRALFAIPVPQGVWPALFKALFHR